MAKENKNTSSQKGKGNSEYIAPDDFRFKATSYDDIKREMVKDNPTASIAIAFAEEAGLGDGAKKTIGDISKTLMGEAKDFAIRDAAFFGVEHLNDFIDTKITGHDNEKLVIQVVTNAAVVAAKPAMIALEVYKEDKAKRAELRQELSEYAQAYGETIRSSSINPLGKSSNKLLEKLELRLESQSHHRDEEMITSAVLGTAQAVARKLHADHIEGKINAKLDTELQSAGDNQQLKNSLQAEAEKIIAKPRLQTVDLLANNQLGEKGSRFSERAFENQQINMTTGIMAAGAFGANQLDNILGQETKQRTSLIAADLILYLNEQVKEGDVLKSGMVHLDALKKDHTIPKEWGNQMKLEQFVELIFNIHVHDQSGEKIPERFHPKLSEISKEIADAITKPSADLRSEATLHPLALIELVGSGKIVAHDGVHVTNLATAQDEIADAIRTMPILPQMDTVRYLEELGSNYKLPPDEMATQLKDNLRGMDKETRDFMALLIPSQVLVNELGVDSVPLQESRARASEYALDNFKQLITELAEKTDAILISEEGLTRKQVQHIRAAELNIASGNDNALLSALRNREADGVGFAVLSAKETMQELADGKKLMGYEALQAEKQAALEAKQEKFPDKVGHDTLKEHAENAHKREERNKTEGVGENYNPAKDSKVVQEILGEKQEGKVSIIDKIMGKKDEEKDLSQADKVTARKSEPKERSFAG